MFACELSDGEHGSDETRARGGNARLVRCAVCHRFPHHPAPLHGVVARVESSAVEVGRSERFNRRRRGLEAALGDEREFSESR